jgi:hypothetical protein
MLTFIMILLSKNRYQAKHTGHALSPDLAERLPTLVGRREDVAENHDLLTDGALQARAPLECLVGP